ISTYKKSFGVLQRIFAESSDIHKLYQALYTGLANRKRTSIPFEEVGSALPFIGNIVISGLRNISNEELLAKIKEMLKNVPHNAEMLFYVYTPEYEPQDKSIVFMLNESGELELKTFGSDEKNDHAFRELEAVKELRKTGLVGEDNLLVVEKGDVVGVAKSGLLPAASVIAHTHP
ncbi:MAG: hypothetical protein ACTSPB_23830, partial [Candidatus Thorarchaeota archaeon]